MHLWFDCLFYLGLWKVVVYELGGRVHSLARLSIMQGICCYRHISPECFK